MAGGMDRWTNGGKDGMEDRGLERCMGRGETDGGKGSRVNGRMVGWMGGSGWIEEWRGGWTDEWQKGRRKGWMEGWMNGRVKGGRESGGWTDGCQDGRTDGWRGG